MWEKIAGTLRRRFTLPLSHEPYMVLPRGRAFSCADCQFLVRPPDGFSESHPYRCKSPDYGRFMGTDVLVRPDFTRAPVSDPRTACSDWFEPRP